MTTRKLRFYVVSGNKLSGEAIGAVLESHGNLRLTGWTESFEQAYDVASELSADVVLIDATGDAARALELLRELGDLRADLDYLALGLEDCRQAVDFLEAGASGYVMKGDSLQEVVETIEAVAAGRPPCSPRVAAMVFRRIRELAHAGAGEAPVTEAAPLSRREHQVLTLLATGLRNKEIAQRLGIALSTAGNHVQRVLDKLEVRRRRDAVRRAYEQGLIAGSPPAFPLSRAA